MEGGGRRGEGVRGRVEGGGRRGKGGGWWSGAENPNSIRESESSSSGTEFEQRELPMGTPEKSQTSSNYSSIQGTAIIIIYSELPLGAGLGSSATLWVALSGALLSLSDCASMDLGHQGWLDFGESELDLLNKWAFEGEKIIHGRSSGIDNTISVYGNMIQFRSDSLTRLKLHMSVKMLITNTKVGRNTKALVAGVSERKSRHPDAMTSVFSAVDSINIELAAISVMIKQCYDFLKQDATILAM